MGFSDMQNMEWKRILNLALIKNIKIKLFLKVTIFLLVTKESSVRQMILIQV